jgi:hypothetical protein
MDKPPGLIARRPDPGRDEIALFHRSMKALPLAAVVGPPAAAPRRGVPADRPPTATSSPGR